MKIEVTIGKLDMKQMAMEDMRISFEGTETEVAQLQEVFTAVASQLPVMTPAEEEVM